MNGDKKSRVGYLELLRVAACFLVIVNHTNSGVFLSRQPFERTWWVSLAYFFLSKAAVPVFIMISGSLLLGKRDSLLENGRRVGRIVADIVLFSFLYYILSCRINGASVNLLEFVKEIYQNNITNSYWYLYLYLGILLMLPLLQRMAAGMGRLEYRYLIAVCVVFMGGMPLVIHYKPELSFSGSFAEPLFSVYIGIFFLGYYLEHHVGLKASYAGVSVLVILGGVILQTGLTYLEYLKTPEDYLFFDERTSVLVVVTAAGMFYLARYLGSVIRAEWFWNVIRFAGGCSFGAYLLSDMFVEVYMGTYLELMMRMQIMKALVLYELLIFVTGIAVAAVMRRVPYLKKLV